MSFDSVMLEHYLKKSFFDEEIFQKLFVVSLVLVLPVSFAESIVYGDVSTLTSVVKR